MNRTSVNSSGGNNTGSTLSSKYELLGKIGEGTYGLVYLAYARDNPAKLYAINAAHNPSMSELCTARSEARSQCRWKGAHVRAVSR